jgi:hypothetical protein
LKYRIRYRDTFVFPLPTSSALCESRHFDSISYIYLLYLFFSLSLEFYSYPSNLINNICVYLPSQYPDSTHVLHSLSLERTTSLNIDWSPAYIILTHCRPIAFLSWKSLSIEVFSAGSHISKVFPTSAKSPPSRISICCRRAKDRCEAETTAVGRCIGSIKAAVAPMIYSEVRSCEISISRRTNGRCSRG